MPTSLDTSIAAHYRRPGLLDAILAGLRSAGADPERPAPEELAPIDEFHTLGRNGTLRALGLTPVRPGMHVLDAGSGLGGTARVLAGEHGCRVTGIDLTPEFVEVARVLSERTGLAERCRFQQGSVLDLPFADAAFDAAVSFHVAMNIGARDRFYGELARVLRPGAPLCLFDVMKGPEPGMLFPVPWAETEATSFLRTPDETCGLLRATGFEVAAVESQRAVALDYYRTAFAEAAKADGPPPLGLHLLTGTGTTAKFENAVRMMEDHQTDPVIVVATRR